MTCFACEREPTRQCPRCGRPYCDEHGEDVCDACLNPGTGVPSFTLYRGSLLALLIGTAVAVWLIVQPVRRRYQRRNQALRPQVSYTHRRRARPRATPGAPPAQTPGAPPAGTPAAGAPTPARRSTGGDARCAAGSVRLDRPATPGPGTTPAPGAHLRLRSYPAAGARRRLQPGTGSYTVVSGDTLSSICNQVKPASMSVSECVDRVVTLNRLSSSNEISIGQQLTVPR